jgi:hypothetical protein
MEDMKDLLKKLQGLGLPPDLEKQLHHLKHLVVDTDSGSDSEVMRCT